MSQIRNGGWQVVGTGVILILASWMVDSFLDAIVFGEGDLLQQLLRPEAQELTYRIQTTFFLLVFMTCAWRKAKFQQRINSTLEDTVTSLAMEKARTEAVLASMPDAVTVQSPDLKILYQNPAVKELKGDHVGQYCYAAYHQRDSVCPDCVVCESFADGLPHREEKTFTLGGKTRFVEIVAAPLKDATGQVIAGIECVRDVTARKTDENRLKQQLAAIEASMEGIALLNADGEYFYLNKAHASVYGYPSQTELIGKSWKVLYTDEERQRLEPLVFGSFERQRGWRGEATGLKKDGTLFPQEISLTLLEDGGIICVVRDTTERKKAEEEIGKLNESLRQQTLDLQRTNRELEAFSYSLSHDLRTPLTSIYAAGQALADIYREQLDETGQSLLQAIHSGCENMEEFIEAMLVLFQVTRTELSCAEVDLSSLADEIMAELRVYAPERSVRWRLTGEMMAWCDPHLARILLQNLLGNAWKYTSKNRDTCIEFGHEVDDQGVEFFVRDNGIGFNMSDAERIFKPFQRLHRSGDFPGTGVGLATVQRIIDRHGGMIRAEGEASKGACFFFTLPAQHLKAQRNDPSAP